MDEFDFLTLEEMAEGVYTESRSKFLAFIHHADDETEAQHTIEAYRRQYHDARHVCWAYITPGVDAAGQPQQVSRSSDDGEPSGTAGKPILGRLQAAGLQQVVAVVVRYFGGVKSGTGPLAKAYRTATEEALATANIVRRHLTTTLHFRVGYELADTVERCMKKLQTDNPRRTYEAAYILVSVDVRNAQLQQFMGEIADYVQFETSPQP